MGKDFPELPAAPGSLGNESETRTKSLNLDRFASLSVRRVSIWNIDMCLTWVPSDSNSWPDWCIYTASDICSKSMTITQSDESKPDERSQNQIKVMTPVESKLPYGTDGFEHNRVRVPPVPQL